MKIYQRKSVWYIDYSFNGDRFRYAVGTKTDAEKELQRVVYEIEHSIHRPYKKMVFDNLVKEYLTWAKANKKLSSYKRDLTTLKHLFKYFGNKRINEVAHADAEQYQIQRKDGMLKIEGVSRKDRVSNTTINLELILLKHIFKKAVQWGYLPASPLRFVKKLKQVPGRVRYVKPAEWQRLLSACSPDMRNLVIFARHTGLRRGEILNLQWTDIDWDNKRITVRERKNNTNMIIPIKKSAFNMLTNMHKTATSYYVFPGSDGERRKTTRTAFVAACRRANISDLRFHDLRHTFGSDLINSGADLRTVQQLMGHKSIVSTMRYVHPTEKHMRKVIEAAIEGCDFDEIDLSQNDTK